MRQYFRVLCVRMFVKRKELKMREDEVICSYADGILMARINAEIDHHAAKRIREKIDKELFVYRPTRLSLDFSGVSFMDSSGIAIILGRVESARSVGATVELTGLSARIMRLLSLSGIDRVRGLSVTGHTSNRMEGSVLK